MCLEKDGEVLFFHTFESPVFFQLNFFSRICYNFNIISNRTHVTWLVRLNWDIARNKRIRLIPRTHTHIHARALLNFNYLIYGYSVSDFWFDCNFILMNSQHGIIFIVFCFVTFECVSSHQWIWFYLLDSHHSVRSWFREVYIGLITCA